MNQYEKQFYIREISIEKILLWLGAFFVTSGIIFFFAYNWDELHKFLKLGLVLTLLCIVMLINVSLKKDTLLYIITLWIMIFCMGVELAIFGQVYQTGADAYNLFLTWSFFALGLVFITKSSVIWFTYLILINMTLYLYTIQSLHFQGDESLAIKIVVNFITSMGLCYFSKRKETENLNWVYNTNIVYLVFLFTILIINEIFEPSIFFLFSIPYLVLIYYLYKKGDIFTESMSVLSMIIIFPIFIGNLLPDGNGQIYFGVLIFILVSLFSLQYFISKIKNGIKSIDYMKLPWITNIFILIVTIFSAIGVLSVMGLLGMITKDNALFLGIIALFIVLMLNKNRNLSISWFYGLFVTLLIAEIGIFWGLSSMNIIIETFIINISLEILIVALLQIILFILIGDYLQRIINILVFSLCFLSLDSVNSISYVNVSIQMIFLSFILVFNSYYKKQFLDNIKGLRDGIIITIFMLSLVFVSLKHSNSISYFNIAFNQLILIGLLSYIIYTYIELKKMYSLKIVVLGFVSIFIASFIPAFISIFIILFLSLVKKNILFVLSSFIIIVLNTSIWYYNSELLLLYKSVYMLALGICLFGLYYVIKEKKI